MQPDRHCSDQSPWFDLFHKSARESVPAGSSLCKVGDPVDHVFVIESGIVAELRHDGGHTHVSCLCHPGMLAGVRWIGTTSYLHAVEAMALSEVLLGTIPVAMYVRSMREDGRYKSAALADMSKRIDSARRLSDCLAQPSARDHVMSVLHAIADAYRANDHGSMLTTVPTAILQRLTGCPVATLRSAIRELVSAGLINTDAHGIKLPVTA